MVTSLIDTSTGQFLDEGVVGGVIQSVALPRNPDPLRERYTGNPADPFRVATAGEISTRLAAQPHTISTRTLLRRMTPAEHQWIVEMTRADGQAAQLWALLLADGTINVHGAEFREGAGYLTALGIPSIWPDAATAAARLAMITA